MVISIIMNHHDQDFVSSADHGDREKTPGALTYSERIARKFMESDTVIIIASIVINIVITVIIQITIFIVTITKSVMLQIVKWKNILYMRNVKKTFNKEKCCRTG